MAGSKLSESIQQGDRLTGLLKVCELLAARTRDLHALELKVAFSLWTILALAAGAILRWDKPLPVLPPALFIAGVHAFLIFLLYLSQWNVAKQWDEHMGQVRKILEVPVKNPCWKGWRLCRWLIWIILEALITFKLAGIVVKLSASTACQS